MRFLADENFPKPLIDYLRVAGHDIIWVGRDLPSSEDNDLLNRAEAEGRIVLTLDQDFLQIATQRRQRLKRAGVILFRLHPANPELLTKLVLGALELERPWIGNVALVTPRSIALFPAGRSN